MLPHWKAFQASPAFGPLTGGMAAILLSLPLLGFDFWFDQGVFATVADALLHGGIPYRDAWEHRPPGIFWIYETAFLLLARDLWAVRVAEILAIGAAAAGLARFGERHLGSRAAGWVAALCLPLLYLPFAPNTAQPESFQIPLLVWILALWPRDPGAARAKELCFACGVLIAGAILLKPTAAIFVFGMLSDRLACDLDPRRNLKSNLALTTWTLAGMAAPPVLVGIYYAALGVLAPFWDAVAVFPADYARSLGPQSLLHHLRQSWSGISAILLVPELALLIVGAGQGALLRPTELIRSGAAAVLAWGSVALQARYFQYHWIPLLPFLAVLMAMAFCRRPDSTAAGTRVREWSRKALLGIGVALAALAAAVEFNRSGYLLTYWGEVSTIERRVPLPVATPWGESRTVAHRIQELSGPDDTLFVWGDAPLLYFLSDRRMAGPYPHLMTIIPEWRGPERVHQVIAHMAERPPKLFLVGRGGLWWRRSQEPRKLLSDYPDILRVLKDRYRKSEEIEGFEVWMRTD